MVSIIIYYIISYIISHHVTSCHVTSCRVSCDMMSCCVVLCYAVLCCAALCCIMLCYVVLCYIILCYIILHFIILYYVILYYIILYYIILYYGTTVVYAVRRWPKRRYETHDRISRGRLSLWASQKWYKALSFCRCGKCERVYLCCPSRRRDCLNVAAICRILSKTTYNFSARIQRSKGVTGFLRAFAKIVKIGY